MVEAAVTQNANRVHAAFSQSATTVKQPSFKMQLRSSSHQPKCQKILTHGLEPIKQISVKSFASFNPITHAVTATQNLSTLITLTSIRISPKRT